MYNFQSDLNKIQIKLIDKQKGKKNRAYKIINKTNNIKYNVHCTSYVN